jgi:hypothetical protein
MKIISTLIILLLFSACSFHTGNISSGAHIDCPMIYIATGTASTTKILGIGGSSKDALIVEAKNDLYRKFPYKKGIKLSNFSVDYKNSYFLFVATTKVTVSADVHDCNSIPGNDSIMNQIPAINGFRVGDSILYLYFNGEHETVINKATLVSFGNNDKVIIKDAGIKKPFKRSIYNIYKATSSTENNYIFGFNIGEEVLVTFMNDESDIKSKKKCIIKGINNEKVIIEYLNSKNVVTTQVVEKQFIRK